MWKIVGKDAHFSFEGTCTVHADLLATGVLTTETRGL